MAKSKAPTEQNIAKDVVKVTVPTRAATRPVSKGAATTIDADADRRVKQLEKANDALRTQVATLEKTLAEMRKQCIRLERENQVGEGLYDSIVARLNELTSRHKVLRELFEEASASAKRAETDAQKKSARLEAMMLRLSRVTEKQERTLSKEAKTPVKAGRKRTTA